MTALLNIAMNNMRIHSDRSQVALVHSAQIPWTMSPQQGVERRMLERVGGEVAVATSIVRYQRGSHFSFHTHELGEEFLVLAGMFSDEHGDYPTGTYVRNPPGSSHAPFSNNGCTLFVKLRQMREDEAEHVVIYPADCLWQTAAGYEYATLYHNERIAVQLLKLPPGCTLPERLDAGGMELLVLEGSITLCNDDRARLDRWSWLRHPHVSQTPLITEAGALLWMKRGHFVESVEGVA